MIRQAFQHLPGIGPERLKRIGELGVEDWADLLRRLNELPLGPRHRRLLIQAVEAGEQALAAADVTYLVKTLAPRDHWRILAHYFERAAYFDIETAGLSEDSPVTLIACYARGSLYTFVRHENLDRFLDLLEEVALLVSFNGASFDVPKLLREFHLPSLPCPHVDLRWMCYHNQRRGGLKAVERELGIIRPPDLEGIGGDDAVWLWKLWDEYHNQEARNRLIRYCAADALSLEQVAARLLTSDHCVPSLPILDTPWPLLDRLAISPCYPSSPRPDPQEPLTLTPLQRRLQHHWARCRAHLRG